MYIHSIAEKAIDNKDLSQYLSAGFNIIPLKEHDKIPAVKRWKPFVKQPLSERELRNLYNQNPTLNVGLITGPSSGGLVVIDIDHSPPEELAFLIAQNPTATVQTNRGRHYYYRSKKRLPNLNFEWGELRADGVYVVAPPSLHPDGTQYHFLDDYGLANIATLPDSLIDYLSSNKSDNQRSVARINSRPRGCSKNKYLLLATLPETYKDLVIAKKVMGLCGSEVQDLGVSFRCPLHKDERPSVALYKNNRGDITFYEFHGSRKFLTLPEVYASYICKKNITLKKGEIAIWWLRVLEEIGYINPPTVRAKKLPKDATEPVQKLYNGFIRLLRLRMVYDPNQTSAPFSWSFALNWCGIGSMSTVSKAMKWLLCNGYIKMVEKGCKIGEGSQAALFILG